MVSVRGIQSKSTCGSIDTTNAIFEARISFDMYVPKRAGTRYMDAGHVQKGRRGFYDMEQGGNGWALCLLHEIVGSG